MTPSLLALRALNLGDLLVAVPALHALRRAFPDHRRLLATSPWVHPVVDLVGGWVPVPMSGLEAPWPADLPPAAPAGGVVPAAPVDVVVNLHGNGPQSAGRLDELRAPRRIGHAGHGWTGPAWVDDLGERRRWTRLLHGHGIEADETELALARPPERAAPADRGAVLVHPGAGYGAKRWPPERFVAVVTALRARGHRVLLTGNAGERDLALEVATRAGLPGDAVRAGATDLLGLAALVAEARLLVSGDTGIAHLAAAYATPAVTLYGPVGPELWGPPPEVGHRALHVPGLRRGDPFAADPDPALLGVTVPDVLAECAALLATARPASGRSRPLDWGPGSRGITGP